MMHAVGFWHEHSREDRDDHVTINYDRVASGRDHNFAKKNHLVANLIGKYDICSILHYRLRAFQKEEIKVSILHILHFNKFIYYYESIKFSFCRKVAKRKEKEVAEQFHPKMRLMLKNARVRWASSRSFQSEMWRK